MKIFESDILIFSAHLWQYCETTDHLCSYIGCNLWLTLVQLR